MPTTINASNTTGGAVVTGDGSGILELQSGGVTAVTINGANVTVAGTLTATGGISALTTPVIVTGSSTAGAEIRLPEDTDNGSNYVAIKAPDSLAANLTFTLPSADGANGQVLVTNGSGTLSFASVSTAFTATASGSLTQNKGVYMNTAGQVLAPVYTASPADARLPRQLYPSYLSSSSPGFFAYDRFRNRAYGFAYNATAVTGVYPLGWYGFVLEFNTNGIPLRSNLTPNSFFSTGVPFASGDYDVRIGLNPMTSKMLAIYHSGTNALSYAVIPYDDDSIYSGNQDNAFTSISGLTTPTNIGAIVADEVNNVWGVFYRTSGAEVRVARASETSSPDTLTFTNNTALAVSSFWDACWDPVSGLAVVIYNNKIRTVNLASGVTLGTEYTYTTTTTSPGEMRIVYNYRLNIFQITFLDGSSFPRCVLASLSGGVFTFGTEVIVNSATSSYPVSGFDMYADRMVCYYGASSKFGTITGLNVSFGSAFTNPLASSAFMLTATGANSAVSYREQQIQSILMGTTNITQPNSFIGVPAANYTTGQTATIIPNGNVITTSGLTPGRAYYYGLDGTLLNHNTGVYAGRALSSTQLLLGA